MTIAPSNFSADDNNAPSDIVLPYASPNWANVGLDPTPLWLLAIAILATIAGWLPNRILLPAIDSANLQQQRMATEIAPWTTYAGERLRHGGIPLWNPHALAGEPLLGNGEVGVFYPTIIFHVFLAPKWAFPAAAAAQLYLAGIGAWWLARRLGFSFAGRFAAAVCFMFCGGNLLYLNHPIGQTIALLPAALALCHRLLTTGRAPAMILLSLTIAAAVFAGRIDAAIAFIILLLLGSICLIRQRGGRASSPTSAWPDDQASSPMSAGTADPQFTFARAIGGLCMILGALFTAILLSGIQWLTFAGYISDWGASAFRQSREALPSTPAESALIGLLLPSINSSAWTSLALLSLVGLFLAGTALFFTRRRGALGWLLFIIVTVALGCTPYLATGVYHLEVHIGHHIDQLLKTGPLFPPQLNWSYQPVLFAGAALGFSILAAIGVEHVLLNRHRRAADPTRAIVAGVIVLLIVLVLQVGAMALNQHIANLHGDQLPALRTLSLAALKPAIPFLVIQDLALGAAVAIFRLGADRRAWAAVLAVPAVLLAVTIHHGSPTAQHLPLTPDASDALMPPRTAAVLARLNGAPGQSSSVITYLLPTSWPLVPAMDREPPSIPAPPPRIWLARGAPSGQTILVTRGRIREISGDVQVHPDEKSDWRPARSSDELTERSELRLAKNASVKIEIVAAPTGATITLDQPGTYKFYEQLDAHAGKLAIDKVLETSPSPGGPVIIDQGLAPEFDRVRSSADQTHIHIDHTMNPVTGQPKLELLEDSPERVRVSVRDGTGGWLVIANAFAPGWRATQVWTTGGRTAAQRDRSLEADSLIYPADGFLQAIPLPQSGPASSSGRGGGTRGGAGGGRGPAATGAGGYEMVIEYIPRGFMHGCYVSLAGVFVLLILGVGGLTETIVKSGRPGK